MTARQQRRLQQKAERKAQKLELRRTTQSNVPPAAPIQAALPQPVSERKLLANRANAQLSTGPTSSAGKRIVAQNRTRHGLAGDFRVMPDESQANFDLLLETLMNEQSPADQTEAEFVQQMAEALWLSHRAVRFQDAALLALESRDKEARQTARKDLALFLRYQSTHERAFIRCSTELRKSRNERRRVERGFESQKLRTAQEARKQEMHAVRQAIEKRKQERHELALFIAKAKCERQLERKPAVKSRIRSLPAAGVPLSSAAVG